MENQTKIAVVTGASRGLGKDMAINIAKKGIDVILTYKNNREEAQKVVEQIKAMGRNAVALQLNVEESKSFDTFIEDVKKALKTNFNASKVDFLINNAGVGIHNSFTETTEEQFDTLMNIHLKGVVVLTQKMLSIMNNEGGIVNISSGLTRIVLAGYSIYATMKGAIETLTKYQAKELGERKIRVNVVAPGAIETDFGNGTVRDNADVNKYIASNTALGRVGLPDDIGSVVAFLCTEEAKWINAQRIEVSGGQMI